MKRPRRKHSQDFKAKVALAAIKGARHGIRMTGLTLQPHRSGVLDCACTDAEWCQDAARTSRM